MSDYFDDTIQCPKCLNENAYFNGESYECQECNFEWSKEIENDDASDDNIENNIESNFLYQEKSFIEAKFNTQSLKRLLSPKWKYYKWNELYKECGVEEDYQNELIDTLTKTKDYGNILKIVSTNNLSIERRSEIIKKVLFGYLESRDELPLYPSIKDWALYVNAPEKGNSRNNTKRLH